METGKRTEVIKNWISDYVQTMPIKANALVVGVSGGIDSAVVSTICCMTGIQTILLSMPIRQIKNQDDLSKLHCNWLIKKFNNAKFININLDQVFDSFEKVLEENNNEHAFANSRARLRMVTLYQVAGSKGGIVVGTGNKIEDFGVGFFTKYGDGGVDISPIADCTKSQVWEMGKFLGINQKIIEAAPTDGLWADGRTDQSQLGGLSYQELEEAMHDSNSRHYQKYLEIRKNNLHKMKEIPICKFD
jgi:NAD+ synthase